VFKEKQSLGIVFFRFRPRELARPRTEHANCTLREFCRASRNLWNDTVPLRCVARVTTRHCQLFRGVSVSPETKPLGWPWQTRRGAQVGYAAHDHRNFKAPCRFMGGDVGSQASCHYSTKFLRIRAHVECRKDNLVPYWHCAKHRAMFSGYSSSCWH
jgi:hypothetical protein